MTDRARELLERALECWELQLFGAANCGFNTFEEIRAYLAEPEGNEFGVSEKDKAKLFYGFLLDCNSIGPESAGVNLAIGIKDLIKHHGIGGEDE